MYLQIERLFSFLTVLVLADASVTTCAAWDELPKPVRELYSFYLNSGTMSAAARKELMETIYQNKSELCDTKTGESLPNECGTIIEVKPRDDETRVSNEEITALWTFLQTPFRRYFEDFINDMPLPVGVEESESNLILPIEDSDSLTYRVWRRELDDPPEDTPSVPGSLISASSHESARAESGWTWSSPSTSNGSISNIRKRLEAVSTPRTPSDRIRDLVRKLSSRESCSENGNLSKSATPVKSLPDFDNSIVSKTAERLRKLRMSRWSRPPDSGITPQKPARSQPERSTWIRNPDNLSKGQGGSRPSSAKSRKASYSFIGRDGLNPPQPGQ